MRVSACECVCVRVFLSCQRQTKRGMILLEHVFHLEWFYE